MAVNYKEELLRLLQNGDIEFQDLSDELRADKELLKMAEERECL